MSKLNYYINTVEEKLGLRNGYKKKIPKHFRNKVGIEIGGPSGIFVNEIPIYSEVKSLDGCNFGNFTIWEGSIQEGNGYKYGNRTGYQFIGEASSLPQIATNQYDFLLSSHCLEHCSNPIKTVKEWLRIIKPDGYLLLILPDKRFTFDHKRPITTFNHLLADFENGIDETDLTHLDEILQLHDLERDLPAGNLEQFKSRSLNNFENRCLHHHVFDFELLKDVFNYLNIDTIQTQFVEPFHQIIIGRKKG